MKNRKLWYVAACLFSSLATFLGVSGPALGACAPFEMDKLIVGDASADDEFGWSIAADNDLVIIGARRGNIGGESAGTAYIYRRHVDGYWAAADKLVASDAGGEDYFGWSVAIEGDTAVVGAYGDDDGGAQAGAAYVYRDDGSGNWVQIAKLLAADAAPYDYFGSAVAISGDTILVGAYGDDDGGGNYGGAVYVFVDDGFGNWSQVAQLVASDGTSYDFFGFSLAIDAGVAVIGAYGKDVAGALSGATYVFREYGLGNWVQTDVLVPDDGQAYDNFGYSVAISGDAAVIGAYGDDDRGDLAGAAYVFHDAGPGAWQQTAKLTAPDGSADVYFGRSVAVRGEIALVGAFRDNELGENAGAAYLFGADGSGVWYELTKLTGSDSGSGDRFGAAVALADGAAFAGAARDDEAAANAGAAYVYDLNCDGGPPIGWPRVAELEVDPPIREPGERVTLTARLGGHCPDALNAAFYVDTSFNGVLDSSDTVVAWVDAADGDCAAEAYPLVQAFWAGPGGAALLFARVSYLGDDGTVRWSEPASATLTVVAGTPAMNDLTVTPDPVTPGQMATITATLGGSCGFVDVVAFYHAAGEDAAFADSTLYKWQQQTDDGCTAVSYPTIGADWDGGTGQITFFARARWSDGTNTYWTDPVGVTADVMTISEVNVTDLFADPMVVQEGERVALRAFLDGTCTAVEAVAYYRAAGPGGTLADATLVKWQLESDDDCLSDLHPLVQDDWDGGTGVITFLARARWIDGDGEAHWSAPASVEVTVTAGEPAVSQLIAAPEPVDVGERLTLTAELSGDCAAVEAVAFYRAAGPGGTLDDATLVIWKTETDADCNSTTLPIIQNDWDDGTGVITFLARARWTDDTGEYWTDPLAVEVTVISDAPPMMRSLTAEPDPIEIGERVTLTALLKGNCHAVDVVTFYHAAGPDGSLSDATLVAWQDELDGDCQSVTMPIVQQGWDGGTGVITFLARARWYDGVSHVWTQPISVEVTAIDGASGGGDFTADTRGSSNGTETGFDTPRSCLADLNGDNRTDQADLGLLLAAFEQSAAGDVDGDGDTDADDLTRMLDEFGCGLTGAP